MGPSWKYPRLADHPPDLSKLEYIVDYMRQTDIGAWLVQETWEEGDEHDVDIGCLCISQGLHPLVKRSSKSPISWHCYKITFLTGRFYPHIPILNWCETTKMLLRKERHNVKRQLHDDRQAIQQNSTKLLTFLLPDTSLFFSIHIHGTR